MTQQTIYQILKNQSEQTPDAPAILGFDRKPLTYRDLCQHLEETTRCLNGMGISRNDRVAIVLPNGPEMAVAFLAVAAAATSAPLNPAYRTQEFDFYLSDLQAKALIIHTSLTDSPAREVAQAHGIPIVELQPQPDAGAGIFSLTGTGASPTSPPDFAQPDDVALVLHTSGTTSRPKIVPLTHANVCSSAFNIKSTLRLTAADCCLNVMPLFHIHGLMGATLSSLSAGASLVCTPGFQLDQFYEWLAAFRPTWYTAVPTMHQAILARAEANREIIANGQIRFIRSSSSALPPQVMAGLEAAFNAPVIESYGMTEASHQMASNPLPPRIRKPGTVGLAAGPEVAIMDEAGRLLQAGQPGEIVIRGANVTLGYENNPAANESAFTNGWFRTGDEGIMDEEGYLSITGRIKEMINRGGEKIAPREIDEVFLDHPDVIQATAFALPHPTLGEDLAVAVVLRPEAMISEPELRQFAFSRLADYKVPSQVVIVDEIPKGPTGKLQRIGLADKLSEQLKTRYAPPRNDLEQALVRIWSDLLQLEQVSIYDNFFALGGDSLVAVEILAAIERHVDQKLWLPLLFQAPTIEQLANLLQDGVGVKSQPLTVPIQPGGDRIPFFCVPGHNDNPFIFKDLARYLGPDQPFYALRFPDEIAESEAALAAQIEKMAASFVQAMRAVQPEGPYLVGGYCFGGQVAFEMAQQLHAQGQPVGLVAIFEAYLPGSIHLAGFGQKMRYHLHNFVKLSPQDKRSYVSDLVKTRLMRTARTFNPDLGRPLLAAMQESSYVPRRYPGSLTLFRASEREEGVYYDSYMGWGTLAAGEIALYEIPGGRQTTYKEPHVQILARLLRRCLEQATVVSAPG